MMAHELLEVQYQSRDTLSIILIGAGVSAVVATGFVLYFYWCGRHERRAARLARAARKAARKRRKR